MIKIIAIGKLKEKALRSLVDEYVKRLQPYTKIEIVEVNDESISNKQSKAEDLQVLQLEGERVLKKIKDKEYVIVLDLHGKTYTSESFAGMLSQTQTYGHSDITFVIGGSLGLSKDLIQRANARFKLSDLTFTHQMVRVLLLEQVYRAYKINNNETYHK